MAFKPISNEREESKDEIIEGKNEELFRDFNTIKYVAQALNLILAMADDPDTVRQIAARALKEIDDNHAFILER